MGRREGDQQYNIINGIYIFRAIEDPNNKFYINTIVMIVVYCEWEPFYIYITRKLHVRVTGKIQFRL